jgi:hypothetical protein
MDMKRVLILLIMLSAGGWIESAGAVPILNTTDFFANGTSYGTYTNSGDLLFVEAGNNLGNYNRLARVESLVEAALHLDNTFQLLISMNITFTAFDDEDGDGYGRTGTWATLPPVSAISFYAVKAGNAFAMYLVDPAEGTGSWSTFDIWKSGLQGTGGRGGLEISHFTGYNPAPLPVPEPFTIPVLGAGLIGLAGYGMKKFKKS